MKFQYIRRVGVLVFVLFLALTLTLALTAPGRATAGGGETETTSPEPTATPEPDLVVRKGTENYITEVEAHIGETLNLEARWYYNGSYTGKPKENATYTYHWSLTTANGRTSPDGVKLALPNDTQSAYMNIVVWDTVDSPVTVTVTAREATQVVDTFSLTLKIEDPVLKVTDKGRVQIKDGDELATLKIGDTNTLDVACTSDTAPVSGTVKYKWECEPDDVVMFSSNSGEKVTITALQAVQRAKITVTADWIPGDDLFGLDVTTQLGIATSTFYINIADSGLTITGASNELIIGKTTELKAEWVGTTAPTGATYNWEYLVDGKKSDAVSFDKNNSAEASTVKITANSKTAEGVITCTTTLNGVNVTKEYPLNIIEPDLSLKGVTGDTLTLTFGKTEELEAILTPDPSDTDTEVTYSWECNLTGVTLEPSSATTNKTQVTANSVPADGTQATITVKASWGNGNKVTVEKVYNLEVEMPGLSITADKTMLKIGDSATLTAELPEYISTTDLDYTWEYSDVIKTTGEDNTQELKVWAVKSTADTSNSVDVKLTVTSSDDKTTTTIGTATYTLMITKPALTVTADGEAVDSNQPLTAQIGQEIELKAEWRNGTEPSVDGIYTWEWTSGTAVSPAPNNAQTTKITAKQATDETPETVTVKVTWTGNTNGGEAIVEATYELKVEVKGPTLKIFSGTADVTGDTVVLEPNKPVTLKVVPENVPTDAEYYWELEEKVETVTISGKDTEEATVTTSKLDNPVTIKVTATWDGLAEPIEAKCTLSFAVLVTKFGLDKTELTVKVRGTEKLNPTFEPGNATNKNVKWESSDTSVATVDEDGNVTGVKVGTATITATPEGGGEPATCKVTVVPPTIEKLVFSTSSPIIWAKSDPASWDLSVALSPADAKPGDKDTITWSVKVKDGNPNNPLKLSGTGLTASEDGLTAEGTGTAALTARLTAGDPGEYTVTVTYESAEGEKITESIEVHVSGITLTRTKVTLLVGQNATIAIDQMFGLADSGVTNDVEWSTSDPSVVTVMHGGLTARKLGKAVITVTKNGYTAECEVEVTEDGEATADNGGEYYKATTGNPLKMSEVWDELDLMSQKKTGDRDDDGEWIKGTGSHLAYITNLSVPTSQGTLYYDYSSEANTGTGIRLTDRFAETPDSTQKRIDRLYFVPRQGFKGTAEITFIGWAKDGTSFSGVIKVEVSGADASISYRTRSDTPLFFLANDFDAFSRSQKGRGVSYVTFDLPNAGQGVLYYNYLGGDGIRVSASTRFYQTGRYTIGDVCFVPNPTFAGEVRIKFHIVDTAGESLDEGWVVINVSPAGGDSTGIYLSGGQNDPVTFQAGLLNDICKNTINEPLNFVIFKLPALEDGILYYDYRGAGNFGSRVNATTRYFFSGVPGINNVTFVPAANATGRIAISYTGYGMSGNSFDGTLYVDLGGVNRTTIYYFASKNSSVTFNRADFNNAGLYQTGAGVSYVTFKVPDDTSLGTLYYDYRSSSNNRSVGSYSYYISPKSGQRDLALISFRAKGTTGSVTIPYTAYDSSNKKLFEGSVVIQVGSVTPVDTGVYCTASGYVGLSASALNSACSQAMNGSLSYIEITSLPGAEVGRLYLNYYGFGTGTAVKEGDKFYYSGSPGIGQLSFVPHAGFTGEAEITYIGYSGDGEEQVSGRIIVSVTRSVKSRYFNDMGGYEWAIDSVDYLRLNGAVEGVGNNSFAPSRNITRGDFILMLVRAYGFTASGSASYHDVSASDYYAEAVRIATVLGIVQGYGGYFNPRSPISRQDAMVMIFRSLKAGGMTITNGLAADLSAFYDRGQIDSYALEAVGSLVQMRVVEGDGNGYLRPRGLLNRAEAAKLLHTIMTL